MHRILVLHGPNLNLLGTREPQVYGSTSLDEVDGRLRTLAAGLGCEVECLQSNHEGVLIDSLHGARGRFQGVLLNPGGLTHTSVALHDAVLACGLPVIEVHVSNPHRREDFRHTSRVSRAALGVVSGFGPDSYSLALQALAGHLDRGRAS
jgi:3-dehydroquinate dehydratase-2